MKKTTIFILIITAAFQVKAQNDAISRFFSKYENDESFTQVKITSRMFRLFADIETGDPEDQAVMETISDLEGLKILSKENGVDGKKLYNEAMSLLPRGEFEELMSIRSDEENMKFFIKEKEKKVRELILIIGSKNEFFIMSLVGNIDLNQVSKMANKMQIQGFEHLEKIEERRK